MATPFWGLYDGLSPKASSEVKINDSSDAKKRTSEDAGLKPRITQKRPGVMMAPRVARMVKRGIKETAAPTQKKVKTNDKSSDIPMPDAESIPSDPKTGPNITQALKAIKDPYDPAEPNDYQEYCKERIRKQQERERQVEMQLQQKERQQELKQRGGATFNGVPGMSPIAEKLMKKMGWKGKGHGLGRQEQGITAPLIAQKSGAGAQGIIIHADSNKPAATVEALPSTVVVLRNMVGPGEVDDMLCGETARECMKYGNVLACEVWEAAPASNLPPEEAVRLFVKFEKVEQAHQALVDLDGRFFAGRNVKADYYARDKFEKAEFDLPITVQ